MSVLVLSPAKIESYAKVVTTNLVERNYPVIQRCFDSFERHQILQAKLLIILLPTWGYLSGKVDTQELQKCFDHGNLLSSKSGYSLLIGRGLFKNRASLRFMAALEERGFFLLGSAVIANVAHLKKEISSWNLPKSV